MSVTSNGPCLVVGSATELASDCRPFTCDSDLLRKKVSCIFAGAVANTDVQSMKKEAK